MSLLGASVASADTFHFTPLTSGNSILDGVGAQLSVEVTAVGSAVNFRFTNGVGTASTVAEIYFGYCHPATNSPNIITGLSLPGQSANASFALNSTSPSNLPSGNTVGFHTSQFGSLFASADNGSGGSSGLNSSDDYVDLLVTFTGKTFANVISAMNNPSDNPWFRIGLHVRSIDGWTGTLGTDAAGSMSYLNTGTSIVPLPAAVWPGMAMIAGLVGLSAKRRRTNRA